MSHPFLWLAGFYMLDRLDRQSRVLREHAVRLQGLEAQSSGTQELEGRYGKAPAGGCLTVLMMVCVVLPCCMVLLLALVWFLLATTAGHCLLALCGVLLLLAIYLVKKG